MASATGSIRRQRQHKANGWVDPGKGYAFWPAHVLPSYGASEAINIARKALFAHMEGFPADAQKDMARVRLLKDFFLDSESNFWEEMNALYTQLESELPEESASLTCV